ncbi:hypothetical protein Tco_0116528 [Tanacetum coccineum]
MFKEMHRSLPLKITSSKGVKDVDEIDHKGPEEKVLYQPSSLKVTIGPYVPRSFVHMNIDQGYGAVLKKGLPRLGNPRIGNVINEPQNRQEEERSNFHKTSSAMPVGVKSFAHNNDETAGVEELSNTFETMGLLRD